MQELESIIKKKDLEANEAVHELERLDEYSKTLGRSSKTFHLVCNLTFQRHRLMKCKNIVTQSNCSLRMQNAKIAERPLSFPNWLILSKISSLIYIKFCKRDVHKSFNKLLFKLLS